MLLSAGQSIWPFHLCITSLPPEIRMNVDYLLLAGVWLGPGKPSNIFVFLQLVLDKIQGRPQYIRTVRTCVPFYLASTLVATQNWLTSAAS